MGNHTLASDPLVHILETVALWTHNNSQWQHLQMTRGNGMDYLAGEIHTDDLLLWASLPSITGATVSICMSTMRRPGREFLSTDPPVTFSMKDSTLLTTQPTDLCTQP